jgi:hypothetical protein
MPSFPFSRLNSPSKHCTASRVFAVALSLLAVDSIHAQSSRASRPRVEARPAQQSTASPSSRETGRGGYSSRQRNPAATTSASKETQVIAAGYYDDEVDSQREPSVVVQAACPNCQSSSVPSSIPMPAPDLENSGTSVEESSMGSSDCDSCDASCGNACGGLKLCWPGGCGITFHCDPCSPLNMLSRRVYARAESAFFWGSGQSLPTLVTTSDANPILPIDEAGLLDDPDTRSLFGGGEVGAGSTNGLRFEAGLWLDDCSNKGILFRLFDSGDNDIGITTNNTINSIIARNFLDVGPPEEQSLVSIAYPNQTSGNIAANLSSSVYGGDLLWRSLICRDNLGRWDWIGGYQTARLDESIDIVSQTNNLNAPNPILDQEDHFQSRNIFHGGNLGLRGQVRDGCWHFDGLFKLGIGNMERQSRIFGSSTTTVGTDVATQQQGLLARRTNSGTFTSDTFVWVPEVGLTIGYRLTHRLDFNVGYSMLRLPKVGRVVDTLDPDLASNLSDPLTGEIRPSFTFRESNFTLHSLNLGLQWAY